MNELEGMINGLLSNPEEMKKLMDMAGKILNTENADTAGKTGEPVQQTPPDLKSILSGLIGNSGDSTSSTQTEIPNLDGILSGLNEIPGGLMSAVQQMLSGGAIQKLMSGGLNKKNDKKELIDALKPWISEKRRHKLDKAMTFAKVMRVAGVAAAFKKGG